MGQFDDDKYVNEMRDEFAPKIEYISDDQRDKLSAMIDAFGFNVGSVCQKFKIKSLKEIPAEEFENVKKQLNVWSEKARKEKENK